MPQDQVRHVLLLKEIPVELQDQKTLELYVHVLRIFHMKDGANKSGCGTEKSPGIVESLAVPYDTSIQQLALSLEVRTQRAQPLWPGCLDKALAAGLERFEAAVPFFQPPDIYRTEQGRPRCRSLPIALLADDAALPVGLRDFGINLKRFTQPLEIIGKFLIESANAGRQIGFKALLLRVADLAGPAILQNGQSTDHRNHS